MHRCERSNRCMKKLIRIGPYVCTGTILFDNFKLIKGVHFESWRTVGSIMQAVKIYNLREVDELIVLDISATNNKKKN